MNYEFKIFFSGFVVLVIVTLIFAMWKAKWFSTQAKIVDNISETDSTDSQNEEAVEEIIVNPKDDDNYQRVFSRDYQHTSNFPYESCSCQYCKWLAIQE